MHKIICKSTLVLLFIFCFSTMALGQDKTTVPVKKPIEKTTEKKINLDLKVLLNSLLENHEEIKTYEHRLESAKAQARQSKGLYYPRLDLFGDAGYEKIDKEYLLDSEENRHKVTLKGTQLITDFGKTTHTIERDKIYFDQSKASLEAIRQKMIRDGVVAYINIVRARERLRIAKLSENRIKELTGIEKTLVQKGAGLTTDVLQAKSQLAGAMALRVQANGELEIAKNRFQAVFYHYPTAKEVGQFKEVAYPTKFVPDNLEQAIATALENNPEVKITSYDVSATQKEIGISKSRYYPSLNLYAKGINAYDNDGQKGYRLDYDAGVEFAYNLYSGGGDQAAIQSALAKNTAASTHLGFAKDQVKEQVRNSWEQLMTLTQTNELLDQQADILKTFLELAKEERKMGTRSLLDVLNGEVNYINAQGDAVAAKEDTKSAAFNLLFAMGKIDVSLFD